MSATSEAMKRWVDIWDKEGKAATNEQVNDLIRLLDGPTILSQEENQTMHLPEPIFKRVPVPVKEDDEIWPGDLVDQFIERHGEGRARLLVEAPRIYPSQECYHEQMLLGDVGAAEGIAHRDIAPFPRPNFNDVAFGITDDDKAHNDLASRFKLWAAQQEHFNELVILPNDDVVVENTEVVSSVPLGFDTTAVHADRDGIRRARVANGAEADKAHADAIDAANGTEQSDGPANKRPLPKAPGSQPARLTPAQQRKRAAAQKKKKKEQEHEKEKEKQSKAAAEQAPAMATSSQNPEAEQSTPGLGQGLRFTDLSKLQPHSKANLRGVVEKLITKAERLGQSNPEAHRIMDQIATNKEHISPGKLLEALAFEEEEYRALENKLGKLEAAGSQAPDSPVKSMFKKSKNAK